MPLTLSAAPARASCGAGRVPGAVPARPHARSHTVNARKYAKGAGAAAARRAGRFVACRAQESGSAGGPDEEKLKQLMALDQLIDLLMAAKTSDELAKLVGENILSFDQNLWMRIAARAETASSEEERARLSDLARASMLLVEAMVKNTEQTMGQSGEVLQEVLAAGANDRGEWELPLPAEAVERMRAVLHERAEEGRVDEAMLANGFAWMRKASDDGLDGMVALIQKVLQLYAAMELSQGAGGEGADALLGELLGAEEDAWEPRLRGAAEAGEVTETALMEALQRRMEGAVLNLPSGSYAQRIQAEYLKEFETRAREVFASIE
ncbi:unnamed protein product [Pedinophyceae sp. YPF-701]|nr:unnamed protein product [Pedinophyceae sp. YPF-701]